MAALQKYIALVAQQKAKQKSHVLTMLSVSITFFFSPEKVPFFVKVRVKCKLLLNIHLCSLYNGEVIHHGVTCPHPGSQS